MALDTLQGGVAVYAFMHLEEGLERPKLAPFKATRQAVEARGGMLLEGTRQVVEPSEVDEDGLFVRVPTGWGDLDG